jgi:membrane-associated phospholipid phosphatase
MVYILGIGLIIAAFSGWLFGALAEDILAHESLTIFDAGISHWMASLTTNESSKDFYMISMLSSAWVILPGTMVLGSWLAWRKKFLQLWMLVLTVGGGAILNLALKNYFMRPRPDLSTSFVQASGYSFPSGHAMISILFIGMTAYIMSRDLAWRKRVMLAITAMTLTLLIGLSRVFLGVHFITDVLGGWAGEGVWLTVYVLVLEVTRLEEKPAQVDIVINYK